MCGCPTWNGDESITNYLYSCFSANLDINSRRCIPATNKAYDHIWTPYPQVRKRSADKSEKAHYHCSSNNNHINSNNHSNNGNHCGTGGSSKTEPLTGKHKSGGGGVSHHRGSRSGSNNHRSSHNGSQIAKETTTTERKKECTVSNPNLNSSSWCTEPFYLHEPHMTSNDRVKRLFEKERRTSSSGPLHKCHSEVIFNGKGNKHLGKLIDFRKGKQIFQKKRKEKTKPAWDLQIVAWFICRFKFSFCASFIQCSRSF